MHKYHLRQNVHLIGNYGKMPSCAVFEVIRLMPAERTGEPTYRIKSSTGERAVRESEINSVL